MYLVDAVSFSIIFSRYFPIFDDGYGRKFTYHFKLKMSAEHRIWKTKRNNRPKTIGIHIAIYERLFYAKLTTIYSPLFLWEIIETMGKVYFKIILSVYLIQFILNF